MYFRVNFEVRSGYGGPFQSVPVCFGPFRLVNTPASWWSGLWSVAKVTLSCALLAPAATCHEPVMVILCHPLKSVMRGEQCHPWKSVMLRDKDHPWKGSAVAQW